MAQRHRQTTINIDYEVKQALEDLGGSGYYGNFNSWDEFMLYIIDILRKMIA